MLTARQEESEQGNEKSSAQTVTLNRVAFCSCIHLQTDHFTRNMTICSQVKAKMRTSMLQGLSKSGLNVECCSFVFLRMPHCHKYSIEIGSAALRLKTQIDGLMCK